MRTFFVSASFLALSAFAGASVGTSAPLQNIRLVQHESRLQRASLRGEEFKDVAHTSQSRCSLTTLPEPLATPDPLLDSVDRSAHITVSFIIGTDGHTHSPLILESAGATRDRVVLRMVKSWRYRPATCNGVPTDFEGKIQFSRN
jgi:Gram-negative bacterial TonB protein C-terminal